ncbi:hypothetical protein L5515_014707 [Caenorhabditis briggsae]|uniref:Acyl-coenzyme A thioesterase 8 n=1 Tax=Caenorhabditis briggsae TaxID=6238 RepID=A0AAE9E9V9_CAEBR|nr:hypothetical protein L3Y34_018584 [Caenorhabditis briggsae]UMM18819.1 hypothetical protein L5515_014707 [Caenorhabditis briggsae]
MAKPICSVQAQGQKMYTFVQVDDCTFRAEYLFHARQNPNGAAYGGLVFSQALAAAEKTVPENFKPNSVHSYFVSAVNYSTPAIYKVRRIRDGRGFINRTVETIQNDKICFLLQVSFHKTEKDSMIHQDVMPKVPKPETLVSMRQAVIATKKLVSEGGLELKPAMLNRLMVLDNKAYVTNNDMFEARCTNLGNWYGYSSDLKPELSVWMKTRECLGDEERLHRWLLACMSDAILIPAAMSAHFSQGFEDSLHVSLDHCLYFHTHDFRVDEWFLFECKSTVSSGGRAFINGRIWRRDGKLIASCQQEAIVRGKDGQISKL